MKITKFMAIAMAATVGLASCAKDDNGADNTAKQALSIRIAQPESTRAIGTPATNGAVVTFSNGNLILTKSNGEIVKVYTFSSSATNVNDATPGTNINITDAVVTVTNTDGVLIENVPGDVTKAFIVGNTSSFDATLTTAYNAAAVVGKNISGVKALKVAPAMQYDATNKGLAKATLYGEGNVVDSQLTNGSSTLAQKEVVINLYPHVARIEIADITGTGDITEYHVNGLFINKYYPAMTLNFTPDALINNGQDDDDVYDAETTEYPAAMRNILYDSDKTTYFGNATATVMTKTAGAGKIWAYNVLAAPVVTDTADPLKAALTSATTAASQIIVQVQGVKVQDGSDYSNLKYLTVNKLYEGTTKTTEITHFKAGYVYRIEAGVFTFSKENVKEEANLSEIDLHVLVKPITWTVQPMNPELQ